MTLKQVARKLENAFEKWDFNRAIEHSNNETNTRDYPIEIFLTHWDIVQLMIMYMNTALGTKDLSSL